MTIIGLTIIITVLTITIIVSIITIMIIWDIKIMGDKLEDLTTLSIIIIIITIIIIMIISGRIVLVIVTIAAEVGNRIIITYHQITIYQQIIISHKDKRDKKYHKFLTIYKETLIINPIIMIITEIIIIYKEMGEDIGQGLI